MEKIPNSLVNFEAETPDLRGTRIMIVDDDQALIRMMHEFLTAFGARIDSYTGPSQALQAFAANLQDFDLVITDQTMPGMTGMELSAELLKLKPGLPIILCTGFCQSANAESVKRIGVAGFFNKPINVYELVLKVQALLAAGHA